MIELCCDLATNHGGDVAVAADMIREASAAGAHTIKLQSYSLDAINPADPQADWLRKSHLDERGHSTLQNTAETYGVQFLSTPFDVASLEMLRRLGCRRFKIASSQSGDSWWPKLLMRGDHCVISYPWGSRERDTSAWFAAGASITPVTAIPLYPTPLEAVERATLLDGWSDHCVGLTACHRALALGVTYLEVHMAGPARTCAWDKSLHDIRTLRHAIDDYETIRSGVSQQFRERWR